MSPVPDAIRVRAFEPRDAAPAADLTNRAILNTAAHFGTEAQNEQDWLDALNSKQDRHPWLTAERDGAFAGYAKSGTWRGRDAYRHTAELTVYTHPDHARLGVATALYTALIDRLAGLGFHAAVAAVTLPNPASVALHERLGFTHAGTFREVGRKFDAWHDVAFFQRPITRTP